MRALLVAVALVVGLVGGLVSGWLAVRPSTPVGLVHSGAWLTWPQAGTPDEDPYSKARLARSGELPLASGEGLELIASNDDDGQPLFSACTYRVEGRMPPARLWTLTVERADGAPLPRTAVRRGIGSDAVARLETGDLAVSLAPRPRLGTWLSGEGAEEIRLVARLYDTTARSATAMTQLVMPRIVREACA